MKRINIAVGQGCEIDCIYCKRNYYQKKGNNTKNFEDVNKELTKDIREYGANMRILFTGVGEPLMLPNLLKICRKLHMAGIPFDLETNGLKLSDIDLCHRLLGYGLKEVNILFNSHIPEDYNKISGNHKYYNKIIKSIKNLESLSIPTFISIVIMKQNLNYFNEIPLFIKKEFPKLELRGLNLHLVRINSPIELFKDVAFPLSKHSKPIESKILDLIDKDFLIGFPNSGGTFPFCFFPKLIKFLNHNNFQFTDDKMHTKTKYCPGCRYYNSCPGIAYTYLQIYGDEEFKGRKFKE